MKEQPTVYVVINEDGDCEAAFYQKSDAIDYCITEVNFWDIPGVYGSEWETYYRLEEVKVN